MGQEFIKWWPFYRGHYLLKGIDLLVLFNSHDSDECMDMIDNLIVEDSVYDEQNQGMVLKKRSALNKEYGRIGITIDDERVLGNYGGNGEPEYLMPEDDGTIPGLDPRITMMGA